MLCKLIVEYNNFSMEIIQWYDKVVKYGNRYVNRA